VLQRRQSCHTKRNNVTREYTKQKQSTNLVQVQLGLWIRRYFVTNLNPISLTNCTVYFWPVWVMIKALK
jgi:hypothetical protein